ncbi:MAG TPA: hypothetical protein VF266_00235, partial [Thermoanaerobaculia bacterium]
MERRTQARRTTELVEELIDLAYANFRSAIWQLAVVNFAVVTVLFGYFLRNPDNLWIAGLTTQQLRAVVWSILVGSIAYFAALLPLLRKSREELSAARW